MLLIKWNDKIKKILSEDNYNCMEIDNEEVYSKLMDIFPVKLNVSIGTQDERNTKGDKYIKILPYSACVPKIFIEMKEFVNNCVRFAEGLNSSQTELDDMIRKPTNKLITDKLNESIRSLIVKVSLAQVTKYKRDIIEILKISFIFILSLFK